MAIVTLVSVDDKRSNQQSRNLNTLSSADFGESTIASMLTPHVLCVKRADDSFPDLKENPPSQESSVSDEEASAAFNSFLKLAKTDLHGNTNCSILEMVTRR